jgi:VanZ family protein
MLRRVIYTLLGLYWGMCFWATHVPMPPGPPATNHIDKLKHFIGYGGLGGAWYITLLVLKPRWRGVWLAVILIGMSYGAIDELTQPPFGRTCDFYDWLADMAGVLTAVMGMLAIQMTQKADPLELDEELVTVQV